MAKLKDLQNEVNRLNGKYCKNTKNYLSISRAYGGYQVVLTGKRLKNNPYSYYKGSLGSGCASITNGFSSATIVLNDLYKSDSRGYLKSTISHYEKR